MGSRSLLLAQTEFEPADPLFSPPQCAAMAPKIAKKPACSNVKIDPINIKQAASTSPAASHSPSGQERGTLYTLAVSLEAVDVGDRVNAGARLVIADGASIKAGKPGFNHGLSTLASRPIATLNLPAAPGTITNVTEKLLPPGSVTNPYHNVSWAFVKTSYGTSKQSAAIAQQHVVDYAIGLLDKAYIRANIDVPAFENKTAWAAESTVLTNRIKLARTGTTLQNTKFGITELINMQVTITTNFSKNAMDTITAFAQKHPNIIVTKSVSPGAATAHSSMDAKEDLAVKKRPASKQ